MVADENFFITHTQGELFFKMSTLDDLEDLSTDSDDEEYIPEGAV